MDHLILIDQGMDALVYGFVVVSAACCVLLAGIKVTELFRR